MNDAAWCNTEVNRQLNLTQSLSQYFNIAGEILKQASMFWHHQAVKDASVQLLEPYSNCPSDYKRGLDSQLTSLTTAVQHRLTSEQRGGKISDLLSESQVLCDRINPEI